MEVLEVLKLCRLEGSTVFLPDMQLDRKLYQLVAKKIEMIGGKWNKKQKGFFFEEESTIDYFPDICNGDDINLQKEYQFFETPEHVADMVAMYASGINWHETPSKTLKSRILEPSAGKGALIKALQKYHASIEVDCYELFDINRKYLRDNFPNARCLGNDFMEADETKKYDFIVMNPPFNKRQYVDHVMKAWRVLDKGGTIVTIVPPSYKYNSNKKEQEFKKFIEENAEIAVDLKEGEFKSSGTMIQTQVVVINKGE
jgi:16S rRNA G966 N2-methylase RsmD